MNLKRKPNTYDVIWSYKNDPSQWGSFRVEEDKLQLTILQVMSDPTWQLECVALISSSNPNRYEIPS